MYWKHKIRKRFIIVSIFISSLVCAYDQIQREYFSTGFSFRYGTLENGFVGSLNYCDYILDAAFIRRSLQPFPLIKSQNPLDVGWGIHGKVGQEFLKTNELKRESSSFEVVPVVRLFLLQNGFIEIGYSLKYFLDGHMIIRDSSSSIVYALPRDKGFESGMSFGAGYLFEINDFIAIEPRLVLTMNNYVKSETGMGISEDILRNIRLVLSINFVRSK